MRPARRICGEINGIDNYARYWVAYARINFGCYNRTPQTGGLRNLIHLPSSRGWASKTEALEDMILSERLLS